MGIESNRRYLFEKYMEVLTELLESDAPSFNTRRKAELFLAEINGHIEQTVSSIDILEYPLKNLKKNSNEYCQMRDAVQARFDEVKKEVPREQTKVDA